MKSRADHYEAPKKWVVDFIEFFRLLLVYPKKKNQHPPEERFRNSCVLAGERLREMPPSLFLGGIYIFIWIEIEKGEKVE
jgi:hypothetical protein